MTVVVHTVTRRRTALSQNFRRRLTQGQGLKSSAYHLKPQKAPAWYPCSLHFSVASFQPPAEQLQPCDADSEPRVILHFKTFISPLFEKALLRWISDWGFSLPIPIPLYPIHCAKSQPTLQLKTIQASGMRSTTPKAAIHCFPSRPQAHAKVRS